MVCFLEYIDSRARFDENSFDCDLASDSPSNYASLGRVYRAQGDGADSDVVPKPFIETSSSEAQKSASRDQRPPTFDKSLTEGKAWYEDEEDGYEEVPIGGYRHGRPEGLSPPVDATNDSESIKGRLGNQRMEFAADQHVQQSVPRSLPAERKQLDDSSSESSSDIDEKPIPEYKTDRSRDRLHKRHGHSHTRHYHRSSGRRHRHHNHRGNRSAPNDGMRVRRYARPQFNSTPTNENPDGMAGNPMHSSVSSLHSEGNGSTSSAVRNILQRYFQIVEISLTTKLCVCVCVCVWGGVCVCVCVCVCVGMSVEV